MKKLISLILTLAILTLSVPLYPSPAKAAPQDYTYTYNLTNLYANYPLVYLFEDLTADVEYTWNIQRVGLDGSPQDIIGSITRTPAVADAGLSGFVFTNFPDVDTPFRVTDNFGRILGRHFLARNISTSAYWNTAGANELVDRTEIRRLGANFSSTLVDNNGQAIDGLACCYDTMGVQDISQYVSNTGDFLLIHYNIDPSVTESVLEIRSLTNATLAFRTNMLEVVDYNLGDGYLFSTGLEYKDFIVLSTVGQETNGYVSTQGCPFCDPLLAVAKFPTSSIPMYSTLGNDFYECARINDESTSPVIHPCEYMMGINPSNTPMQLSIPRSSSSGAAVDKPLRLDFRLSDSSVWNALASHDFFFTLGFSVDGLAALIAAISATPFTSQSINVTPLTEFTNAQGYWTMCPTSQYYQSDWLLCLSRVVQFNVRGSGGSVSFSESIDSGLADLDFDNEFSHIMLLILINVLAFGFISFLGRKVGSGSPPHQLYDLVFIGTSVLLVIIGFFGVWTSVILLILCVLAFMHAMKGSGASNDA